MSLSEYRLKSGTIICLKCDEPAVFYCKKHSEVTCKYHAVIIHTE